MPPEDSKQGILPDPYHIWLSEVMLQQTTVKAVIDYFQKFLRNWPTLHDLAAADIDDVMTAWAGLGYYSRARNLHKCAQYVAEHFDGKFPSAAKDLEKLPGIGDYTSAAISSIAFAQPAPVMDGNIERVVSRLYRISDPLPTSKPIIYEKVEALTPEKRAGDYAQAMMDIGATICTPKNPVCALCPLKEQCDAHDVGDMTLYPQKLKKKDKPHRNGVTIIVINEKNEILIQKRDNKGLFGGMYVFPYTDALKARISVEKPVNKKDMHNNIHTLSNYRLRNKEHIYTSEEIISNIVDNSVGIKTSEHHNKYYSLVRSNIFLHISALTSILCFYPIQTSIY